MYCSAVVQSSAMVVASDHHISAAAHPSVVAQGYTHQLTHDYVQNAHRQELMRRPDADSRRNYPPPDALPSGFSLGQPQNAQGFLGVQRGPRPSAYPAAVDQQYQQPMRAVERDAGGMRCETCSRPAMFVCSACRKAPYCSVECQVCVVDFMLLLDNLANRFALMHLLQLHIDGDSSSNGRLTTGSPPVCGCCRGCVIIQRS